MDSRPVSLIELEATFERELLTDKRAAAEMAYALACPYRTEDIGPSGHPFSALTFSTTP